jgi:hypothetical protein
MRDEWRPVYRQLLFNFDKYCIEADQIAMVDNMFVADCRIRACLHLPATISPSEFPKLSMQLRILAAQHTPATRQPINLVYVEQLRNRIALMVAKHIRVDFDHQSIVELARYPCEDADVRNQFYELQFSSDAIHKEAQLLTLKALEARLNNGDDDDDDIFDVGDDDINRGEMFFEKPEAIPRTFMVIASRLFRCIDIEAELCSHFPQLYLAPAAQPQYEALRAWLRECADIQVGDMFLMQFRMMCFEYMVPMGSRLDTMRSASQQGEEEPINNVLQKHLGINVAQHLQEQGGVKLPVIASDPSHPLYDMLLLKMFTYMFEMKLKLSFWEVPYIVKPWELLRDPEKTMKHALAEDRLSDDRRPVFFYLLRQWRLLVDRQWVVCNSLSEAILLWLRLIMEQFGGELEGGQLVHRLHMQVFPLVNHELEELKKKRFDT